MEKKIDPLLTKKISHDSKVVIIGNMSVGKTSFINQYVNNTFHSYNESTIGASFFSKVSKVDPTKEIENNLIKLNVWDTAGQERYYSLIPMYYRETKCVIIIYDVTDSFSFQKIKDKWVPDLYEHVDVNTLIVILGNKIDLEDKRKVTYDEGKKYADENNFMFNEISVKNNINVEETFQDIITYLVENDVSSKPLRSLNYDHPVIK